MWCTPSRLLLSVLRQKDSGTLAVRKYRCPSRTAAGHGFVQSPLRRISDVEPCVGLDDLDRSELLAASHLNHGLVVWFITAAIADHQFFAGFLAGINHGLTIGDGSGHRLFAKHVLASFESADGVLRVHAVGQDDVNHIDFRVVLDGVVIFVVVDIFGIYAIALRDLVRFVRMAAD